MSADHDAQAEEKASDEEKGAGLDELVLDSVAFMSRISLILKAPARSRPGLGVALPPIKKKPSQRPQMGRPSKIVDDNIRDKLIAAIQRGAYIETAAAFAGINKDTFYRWLKKGSLEKEGPFRDFSDAVEKAMAESEVRDIDLIDRAAAKGTWQASAWRLERKFPKRWGRKQAHILTGTDGGPVRTQSVPIDLSQLSDGEIQALDRILGIIGQTADEGNGSRRNGAKVSP